RMRGFNTLWVPGLDHAGIATQAVVEKQLKENENKTRHDVGREELVRRIWGWKEQYGNRIIEQLKRLGCSCDWDRTRFTLDEQCARAVRETFFKLFKDGLIYRGKRLVNWDIHLQTSISDDEIYHETVKTSLWHVRYPIEGTDKFLTVATTRPETMLGDTAVAVHSEDPRWNWAIGKQVALPLTDRKIPIIADDILVDPKFGSGVVKVTPAHDPNDYAVWQRHQNQADRIDIINILNPDGRLNENAGGYAGMKREAARKKVVEDLTALGLLEKEEPYETQVGHSDRSKTPVEPYLSDQWFVKMAPLAEPALEVVRKGIIQFFPERHAQQYLAWLGEKRDWPISRQLWWGHRIPVWTKIILGGSGMQAFKEIASTMAKLNGRPDVSVNGYTLVSNRQIDFTEEYNEPIQCLVCLLGDDPDVVAELESRGLVRDPDVLDTWFSSALWPHSTLGWPEQTPELKKYYPTSVLVTGRDIITLWVARMVMTGMYNMGETSLISPSHGTPAEGRGEGRAKACPESPRPNPPLFEPEPQSRRPEYQGRGQEERRAIGKRLGIPFFDVAINPTILDGKGERMSKSKGNGVDPVDIIDTHGADALRFTLTTMATETQDARLPVKRNAEGRNTSEKFDIGRNFANKLWNVVRFALSNLEGIPAEPADVTQWTPADKWILSRLTRTIREIDDALDHYRFDVYARACYDFIWRDLCDWYIELAKHSLKTARKGQTAMVLAAAIDASLRMLHPMMPFITEVLWWRLNDLRPARNLGEMYQPRIDPRLILSAWPIAGDQMIFDTEEKLVARVQEIVTEIRNVRNNFKVEPRRQIEVIARPRAECAGEIEGNREIIEQLANCALRVSGTPPAGAVRTTAAGCELFLVGLAGGETDRLAKLGEQLHKRRDELLATMQSLQARLHNPGYTAKAPAHLVEQTRKQLADAQAELGTVEAELTKLG
ncbi:MAG TPA: valine--tRNA ligase, partial [Tepidisphaeraceae bacterium]|nr:valine--tRNA ligase [Tepidisphaeraceae bacterium]